MMKLEDLKRGVKVSHAGFPFVVGKVCEWSITKGSDEAMVEIYKPGRPSDGACVSNKDLEPRQE